MERRILQIRNKADAIVLRQKTAPFDFSKFTQKEIRELIKIMRITMKAADGVGLSANQIGLNLSLFIAQIDRKVHVVFNPKIVKTFSKEDDIEEGCLSILDTFGMVRRPVKISVDAQDSHGRSVRHRVGGLLARVFQHEIDHLNGVLFIDKATDLREVPLQ